MQSRHLTVAHQLSSGIELQLNGKAFNSAHTVAFYMQNCIQGYHFLLACLLVTYQIDQFLRQHNIYSY